MRHLYATLGKVRLEPTFICQPVPLWDRTEGDLHWPFRSAYGLWRVGERWKRWDSEAGGGQAEGGTIGGRLGSGSETWIWQ